MSQTRRTFLRDASASLAAVAAVPYSFAHAQRLAGARNRGALVTPPVPLSAIAPDISAMLARAIDAAKSAGAAYADVRYLAVQHEKLRYGDSGPQLEYNLYRGFGIRALYNGYWGYSAISGECTIDDMAKAGRDAAGQAKTGAKGKPRVVELAPRPIVTNGTWTTPIKVDPFAVSWAEKNDIVLGIGDYFSNVPFDSIGGSGDVDFRKQEHMYAASDGMSYTQTLYDADLSIGVIMGSHWKTQVGGFRRTDDLINRASAGWEYIAEIPVLVEAHTERVMREADSMRHVQPVDVGRYDVVFDGEAIGKLAAVNIGTATELNRAMGYTANREGTSYLNDPIAMLGTFKIGSPLLNVAANRSLARGLNTVKWDEEGVEPDDAVLVKDGILTDFQTTRESASWLAPYYQKIGKPVRSHGGALLDWLGRPPSQGPHNLVVTPSAQETSIEDLYSGIKKGLVVYGGRSSPDQQVLNSETYPELVYEVINGKIGRCIRGAVVFSRAPDFWKNLIGVGGPNTVRQVYSAGMEGTRTASAPAVLVKNVAVTTDIQRSGFVP
jgi:TldD protein